MVEEPTHAGAVVYHREGDEIKYLLVSSSDRKYWVLPKGHITRGEGREGESPWEAAERELREEAGVGGKKKAELSLRHFVKGSGPEDEDVRVQYFLVEQKGSIGHHEQRSLLWVTEAEIRDPDIEIIDGLKIIEGIRPVVLEAASVRRQPEEAR